jgi:hypothetical protein
MNISTRGYLAMHFQKDPIAAFFPILQSGFYLEIFTDNLQELLGQTCGLSPEELKNRIQTIFLNGKPVDELASVNVRDGDCLALSAAMPGLVGATMRAGGVLASFRHSISYRPSASRSGPHSGRLSIKLFNLLIKEIGPRFLEHGVLVEPDKLHTLLTSQSERVTNDCQKAELDDQPIRPEHLPAIDWNEYRGLISVQVTVDRHA